MSDQPNRMPHSVIGRETKWYIETTDGMVTKYKNEKLYRADLRMIERMKVQSVKSHGKYQKAIR